MQCLVNLLRDAVDDSSNSKNWHAHKTLLTNNLSKKLIAKYCCRGHWTIRQDATNKLSRNICKLTLIFRTGYMVLHMLDCKMVLLLIMWSVS